MEKWHFTIPAIQDDIKHSIEILDGLLQVTDILKKFLIFLGPNLKQVTGSSKEIDELVTKVK